MESNLKEIDQSYWDFLHKGYIDFVDEWFLMSSPMTPIMMLAVYLLFVLKIGPAYMKGKPAYSLRKTIICYNAAQVLYSFYLVVIGTKFLLQEGFLDKRCFLQDKEYAYRALCAGYLYLIAKLTEFMDTVFFVLRKKWNQISFLHVYHHSIMFAISWFIIKYSPSYIFSFSAVLNSFVHVIMYAYYGLSAFPGIAKHLWWKKYITKLQLVQFSMIFITVNITYFTSKCPQSFSLLVITWMHVFLFTFLFAKFYKETYRKNLKSNNVKMNKTSLD